MKIVKESDVQNMYDKDLRQGLESSQNPRTPIDVFNNSLYSQEAFGRTNEPEGTRSQMEAFRQQTELTKQELDRVRAEQEVEKRRINEKQIRSLRNNYRGHASSGSAPVYDSNGMSTKLGG